MTLLTIGDVKVNPTVASPAPDTVAPERSVEPSGAIAIDGVSVSYSDHRGGVRQVLNEIELQIPTGQFAAIVGRSGCGKTTLLNMVAGLVEPTAGSVAVMGQAPRRARAHVGFMLARDALLPWRNALRNVEYGLELRGMPKAERRQTARRWLEAVHLGDAGVAVAVAAVPGHAATGGAGQDMGPGPRRAPDGRALLGAGCDHPGVGAVGVPVAVAER